VRPPTSQAGRSDGGHAEEGFTLLELVCVIAIVSLLAALIVPALPRGTSRAKLESYAMATASLLKADRHAALRRRTSIATQVDTASRSVRSGATGRLVQLPNDVDFDVLLPARCGNERAGSTIRFFSSGMSCGGVIALTRAGIGYEVRVNWLTGGIEIAPFAPT
jgi:general secretion pathway protein H